MRNAATALMQAKRNAARERRLLELMTIITPSFRSHSHAAIRACGPAPTVRLIC